MDMISNEILRDLNIKRTFMGVDKVQSYPVDLVKLTVKYELDKSKLQEINRGTQYDLRQWFINPTLLPNIPLIVGYFVFFQKFLVFGFECFFTVVFFLVGDILDNPLNLARIHGKCAVSVLP